ADPQPHVGKGTEPYLIVGLLPVVPPMTELSPQTVTQWLLKWRGGDESALNDLSGLVYEDLHRLAQNYLRRERPDHTLQANGLVHEAYLHLHELQHKAKVVELYYFGGLSAKEIAEVLSADETSISQRTVENDLKIARAKLHGWLTNK